MKIKLLSFFILFLFSFSFYIVNAERKWKDNWNRKSFSTYSNTSVTTTCPTWEVLIDPQQNQSSMPRDGTLICIETDLYWPIITPIWSNWYINGKWTNKDVTLTVNIKDNPIITSTSTKSLWIKKISYSINLDTTFTNVPITQVYWENNFTLTFKEEWHYTIKIIAEDNSTHSSLDASPSTSWNKTEVTYTVNIDKSGMTFLPNPDLNSNWRNVKPIITVGLYDNYAWKTILIKPFTCTWKPANSEWINPVSADWNVVWSCDPAITPDCTNDSNYNPNMTSCSWKCLDWYTKWIDNLCYKNSITLTCDNTTLPTWTYIYNLQNILTSETTNNQSYWTAPTWVSNDGSFLAKYVYASNAYTPNVSSCTYDCREWYHLDSNKCVNDIAVLCCEKDYPLTQSKNVWVNVDCTLAENAANVACVPNPLCWWEYVKDVLKYWTGSEYDYESEWVTGVDTLAEACWLENIPNSDWQTCNPWYYLVWGWTASQVCTRVPLWEWSGQENIKKLCTNKPNKSYYIAHTATSWWANDCPWDCENNYNKDWGTCKWATQVVSCTAKPANTSWNNTSSITQEWDWNSWEPSNVSTYNTSWSWTRCRYECNSWYWWDWDSCELRVNWSCWSADWDDFYNFPSSNLCDNWTAGNMSTSSSRYYWTCYWTNWWNNRNCDANIKKDWACWSADGWSFNNEPSNNLCDEWNDSWVSWNGPWNWTCYWINWWNDDYCSANKN